jgi:hypothetical protein
MRGIFPETKRSWSDGLNLFDDTRDYYELRFGLFGGDDDSGGGGDKPGSDRPDRSNPAEMAAREQDFRESLGFTGDQGRDDFAEAVNRGDFGAAQELERQAAERQFSSTAQDIQNIVDQQREREQRAAEDIFTADTSMVTDMSPVEQQQIAAQQQLDAARNQAATFAPSPVGIQTLSPPGGTLGDTPVYSAVLNDPMRQDERTMNPADFEAQYGFAPRGIAGITSAPQVSAQVVLGGGTDDMGSGVPLGGSYDTVAPAIGMQDEYLPEDIAAGFGQYVGGPGGGPGRSGLSTFADRQKRAQEYAEAMGYDLTDQSTMKRGAQRGFSGITEEQKADLEKRAAGSIFGDTFMNTPRNINKILSNVDEDNNLTRATGIYTNPDGTVRGVTALPDPDGFLQSGVNFLGGFIPDFIGETYTGVGANPFDRGQDPGGGDDGGEVVKSPMDPCPEGFVLKDGVCTPVAQAGGDAGGGPGSGFVMQPPTAPPTFQPMTQATPINQINPFVLQPYTPMQAQNIGASRVAQGIQGVSPTGAALGRQI